MYVFVTQWVVSAEVWKYFAGDTILQTCQFSKNYEGIPLLSKVSREVGIHITGYLARKLKKRLSGFVISFW